MQTIPVKTLTGNIVFIDPVKRVATVRVEICNQSRNLNPEMFVTGIVSANLTEYKDKMITPQFIIMM